MSGAAPDGRTLDTLFLGHSAEPSGAEIALTRLVSEFRSGAYGVAPRVVLLDDGPVVRSLRATGAEVEVRRAGGSRARIGGTVTGQVAGAVDLMAAGLSLGGELRRRRPDLLVAETLKAVVVGAVACRVAGVPLVWHAHDRLTSEYLGFPAARAIRTVVRETVSGIVANSATTLATLPPTRGPSTVVYPGVVPGRARPRAEREPGEEGLSVVMVSRIDHWKGHAVLFDAVARMRRPPRRLVLVGGPLFGREELLADLRDRASGLPAGVEVEFTGHVDDPAPYMAAADVLVHCSTLPEPFGQVVVEAMQQGCAVVAARAGGPTEIVTDGVDGLLHTPGDATDLAATLDRFTDDPVLRATVAAQGRERAADFELPVAAAGFAGLLREVVRQGPHETLARR